MFLDTHHMDAAADIHHKGGVGNICLLISPLCKTTLAGPFIKICQRIHLSCQFSYPLCAKPLWLVRPLKKHYLFCDFSATVSPCCRSAAVSNSLIVVLVLVLLIVVVVSVLQVSNRLKLSDCLIGEQLSGASLQLMRPPFHDDDDEEEKK